jgi:site-specific recombinase XerD
MCFNEKIPNLCQSKWRSKYSSSYDYLNYWLKSIRRRHEELVQTNPHKLRHTFSMLAREGGATIAQISQALTYSDIKTTEIYVNTPSVVDLSTYEKFEKRLDEARQAK